MDWSRLTPKERAACESVLGLLRDDPDAAGIMLDLRTPFEGGEKAPTETGQPENTRAENEACDSLIELMRTRPPEIAEAVLTTVKAHLVAHEAMDPATKAKIIPFRIRERSID